MDRLRVHLSRAPWGGESGRADGAVLCATASGTICFTASNQVYGLSCHGMGTGSPTSSRLFEKSGCTFTEKTIV